MRCLAPVEPRVKSYRLSIAHVILPEECPVGLEPESYSKEGAMRIGALVSAGLMSVSMLLVNGCASMDELNQVKMDNRNLQAEKAQLEQDLFDARTVTGTLRSRADSLDAQLSTKDEVIHNLQRENDGLEDKFGKALAISEGIADRGIAPVALGAQLPQELDTALQGFARTNPSLVTYDSANGTVKWTSDLLFALGSDVVRDSATSSLSQFTEIMQSPAARGFDVFVVGHTDNVPISKPATRQKHPTNWHLSVHRAIAVSNLLQKEGLDASRLSVVGFGDQRPLVANDSPENRSRNRRVEMYIVPHGAFSVGAETATAFSFTGRDEDATTK
jgi:chemotaxis protein MotB